ncbi:galactose-1-phosphate uridylyltransferase [bacterium]|nr:galactose-1-phosphate uridylyltransferase [bacterium]
MKDTILVTGGAGYIGSHTVRRLLEYGRRVVVLDDLSTGHQEVMLLFLRVYGPEFFCFEEVNLLDADAVQGVFSRHEILGIIDFAAKSLVGESQEKPRMYFDNNVLAFRNLVIASNDIPIVKSSTAATYGNPADKDIPLLETYQEICVANKMFPQSQLMLPSLPSKEGTTLDFETVLGWYAEEVAAQETEFALTPEDEAFLRIPTNVYGITKMMDELILAKCASWKSKPYVALRYFNAAGADSSRLIGEDHRPETHLIPVVLQVALGKREQITVFGDDYDTPDGTAVRDYISVQELADAHVLCLGHLLRGGESQTFNLGTGKGFSVREIIETTRRVTGHEIPQTTGPRRSGDPAILIADSSRIQEVLRWEATESLEEIIASAWHWRRLNPEGYRVAQEERFNPFWSRWVNIAAHRRSRPWSGETQDMDAAEQVTYHPDCYLCPGNIRANGAVNPQYTGVWSFPNDFATMVMDAYQTQEKLGPYKTRTSKGVCEVINYSPNHSLRLSTMDVNAIVSIVDEWAAIYKRLGEKAEIKYPLIYENRGKIMGNSQPHPHGQVYAYGEIPDLIVKPQLEMFKKYRETSGGRCFVCDANDVELEDGRRILLDSRHVIAYVPYAAQFPYDVMIVPRAHIDSLLNFNAAARRDLAGALKAILVGLDNLFGVPYHYSLALIQTPTDGMDYGFHMQVHITSLLRGPGLRKHVVGADIFGNLINPSDPNETAEEIRHAMKEQTT